MGFEAGVFRKSWLRRGVRVKARARNVNVSRGAGSCQSTPLRLAGSIGQIMLVLSRSCALLKCFLVCPGLGTGIVHTKHGACEFKPRAEMWRETGNGAGGAKGQVRSCLS